MSSDEATKGRSATQAEGQGRRPRKRRARFLVAIVGAVVVVYALVVVLYAFSGRVVSASLNDDQPPPAGGVNVVLTPESVDALDQRIVMNMQIEPSEELESEDGLTLKRTVSVIVAPVRGDLSTTFPGDAVPSTRPVDVIVDGSIENWPFDVYRVRPMAVLAYTTDGKTRTPLPINVHMSGYVPGWGLSVRLMTDAEVGATSDPVTQYAAYVAIDAPRSGSTIAFGFVLLTLMVLMPCLVLFVAIAAFRAKRKVEPSFMSWMGAMLFATIPLRTFLPGSPPIGSWIDFLVVLWVVVGLISGLAIYVAAWWKWGARSDRADRQRRPIPHVGSDEVPRPPITSSTG